MFIVLIFENGLVLKEQMILEDILSEIGRSNDLSDFPTKLSFEEANLRLVNYNKASKQKEEKVGTQAGCGSAQRTHNTRCVLRLIFLLFLRFCILRLLVD